MQLVSRICNSFIIHLLSLLIFMLCREQLGMMSFLPTTAHDFCVFGFSFLFLVSLSFSLLSLLLSCLKLHAPGNTLEMSCPCLSHLIPPTLLSRRISRPGDRCQHCVVDVIVVVLNDDVTDAHRRINPFLHGDKHLHTRV